MKTYLILLASVSLAACGGGGGGGTTTDPDGGGGTTPKPPTINTSSYPKLTEDPDTVGDVITFDGTKFVVTAKADGSKTTFNQTGRSGSFYNFRDNAGSKTSPIYPIAASNRDVIIVSAIKGSNPMTQSTVFGYDGDWANVPSVSELHYNGQYQSRSIDGTKHPSMPMRIELRLDDIENSVGYDLVDGQQVLINFNAREGTHITGNVSDQNHVTNHITFGLFGKDARTMAGGYANHNGTGVLLVERE